MGKKTDDDHARLKLAEGKERYRNYFVLYDGGKKIQDLRRGGKLPTRGKEPREGVRLNCLGCAGVKKGRGGEGGETI